MQRRVFLSQAAVMFAEGRFEAIGELLKKLAKGNGIDSAVLAVRQKGAGETFSFGNANKDSVFLLASITKPMTAVGVMKLVERGELRLSDPVRKYVPEFRHERVLVKHLLSHTSGLPDMLPENEELRKSHAPLQDFVAGACRTPLLFEPGRQLRYQSMGILLAAEIVERLTKQKLSDFLKEILFRPLKMERSSLGLGGRNIRDTVRSQLRSASDWDWNSAYWRNLAAPWGGGFASAGDVVRLLEYFLNPDERVLRPETALSMIADQNAGLDKAWGIGWGVERRKKTFGHSGSTGTLCWAHPGTKTTFVLLTGKPADESNATVLTPVSDAAYRSLT